MTENMGIKNSAEGAFPLNPLISDYPHISLP